MIYLFNSAYRTLYLKNVLNTLFAPVGCTNEYRYDIETNINQDQYAKLSTSKGQEVVIIFIDRFDPSGYYFYPLRLGRIAYTYRKDDRQFFRVSLNKFIFPKDLNTFNDNLKNKLGQNGLPKLTGEPENQKDGSYAIIQESIFTENNDYYFEEIAWNKCVEKIQQAKKFVDPGKGEKFVFVKCEIQKPLEDEILEPKLVNNKSVVELIRGKKYLINISYKYPYQNTKSDSNFKLNINLGENLKSLYQSKELNIDSSSNNIQFPFITKRNLEDFETGLTFRYGNNSENNEIIGSEYQIEFKIVESTLFWFEVIGSILLFVLSGLIMATQPFSFDSLFANFPIKAAAALGQSLAMYFLIRLVGKKFL